MMTFPFPCVRMSRPVKAAVADGDTGVLPPSKGDPPTALLKQHQGDSANAVSSIIMGRVCLIADKKRQER